MIVEGACQHFAEARLKDVEGEKRIWEKKDPRKRHDGNGVGKFDGFGHDRRVLLFDIRAPGAAELAESGLSRDVCFAE